MTTFNGFMRSSSAAFNRMERAFEKRAREAAKIEKLRQKEEMLANAATAVKNYNDLLSVLTSIHKEAIDPINWKELLQEEAPIEPVDSHNHEQKAAFLLQHYTPSFFDKLFGMVNSKKASLSQRLLQARQKDIAIFENDKQRYRKQQEEWEKMQRLAKGVLNKDPIIYKEATEVFNPFSEIRALGSELNFVFHPTYVQVDVMIQADDVIPKQVLSLTSTGKLSRKDMPISKFNELYQDYACSCLLRIGREVQALLPVDFTIVNIVCDLLNSSNGHVEPQAVVSAALFPQTLDKLNFSTLDPSDSMKNFKHAMNFSKTTGLKPVERLEAGMLIGQ